MIGLLMLAAFGSPADYSCRQVETEDLVACAKSRFEQADAALNSQWGRIEHTDPMLKAQRAWLTFRDAECEVENPADPSGRDYEIHRLLCFARLTDQRTEQLRQLANN